MNKIISYIIVLSLCLSASSLAEENWVSYARKLKVEAYTGLNFRVTASVRTEIKEDSAAARIWARVNTKTKILFTEFMFDDPIRTTEWETYTIEGPIDSSALELAFGVLCQYNGSFYIDQYKVEIETRENHWEKVFYANFENDSIVFVQGTLAGSGKWGINEFYEAQISNGIAAEGSHYLKITGAGVPNFGINNNAGAFAEVNGIKLYYEVYGEGQPLVILHGNGGSIAWATPDYYHFIEKAYRVIAVDSRAQGRSGDSNEELTYELLAADLDQLLTQLGLDSVYMIGQSDGAIVGLVLALNHPDKIEKLVAFAPNIQADTTTIEPPIFRWVEKTATTDKDPTERKLATLMWKHPNIPLSDLENIQAEVLLMSGDRDFVTLDHTLDIFQNLPKAQLCIFPGATHSASWEKEELFHQMVDDFFEYPFRMPNTAEWYENELNE